jgi:hypothetical protein
MAAGTPVSAYKDGGALDYVVEGQTGSFFTEQSVASLVDCLKNFKVSDYSPEDIKQHAQNFSRDNFQKNLQTVLNNVLQ